MTPNLAQRKRINQILIPITAGLVALCCGLALFTPNDDDQDTPDAPVVRATDQPSAPATATPPAAQVDEPAQKPVKEPAREPDMVGLLGV